MMRRLRTPLVTAGGLVAAGAIDRALTPALHKPVSTAATAASIGSVQLYQYQICPFCNKLKALLDVHRVPYDVTEVNPLTKSEIKSWSGGYKKVPIAVIAGEQVNDSPVICNEILDRMVKSGQLNAKQLAAFRSPEAVEWTKWSDSKLAVLAFPNMTRTLGDSAEAFGYVHAVPHFSQLDKMANLAIGSFFMWMANGKIKKKYNIQDERAEFVSGINKWLTEAVGSRPFAGGEQPNLADCAVFGLLKAIDRTGAYRDVMVTTDVGKWYERMLVAVEPDNSRQSYQ